MGGGWGGVLVVGRKEANKFIHSFMVLRLSIKAAVPSPCETVIKYFVRDWSFIRWGEGGVGFRVSLFLPLHNIMWPPISLHMK